jgi:hypothetical protein
MAVGDDKNMGAGNRVDISKCGNPLIAVDDGGRRFTGKNFTEDAGHFSYQLSAISGQK